MQAERVDAGALACAGHSADAYTYRGSRIREALLYDLLRHGLMFGLDALHQSDCLAQDGDIALHDSVHVLADRELAFLGLPLEVGID